MKQYILLVILISLLAFGCASQSVPQNQSVSQSVGQNVKLQEQNKTAVPAGAPLVEINMTARQWEFVPDTITVKKGDHVVIHLTSEDVTHGFMIRDYGINTKIEPGQVATVDFIADKEGTFGFRCSVLCGEGHKEQTGTLTVEP